MTETLTISKSPSSGLEREKKPRTLGGELGDGYGLTIPDGVNTMLLTLNLTWKLMTFDEADDIDDFLTARGGSEIFLWQMPREGSPRRWRCREWKIVENRTEADVVATFMEQP